MNTPDTELMTSDVPEHETARSLFAGFCPFQVPAYQRAYAWEREHVDQFISDLREHPADKQPYYLGHFLLEKNVDGSVFVIDGQQRLTTMVLLMSCIARRLAADENLSAEMQSAVAGFVGQRFAMKFRTVQEDQQVFEDIVFDGASATDGRRRSQKRLLEANKIFSEVVSEEMKPEELFRWLRTLAAARVTWLIVSGKVEATQIFVFQNSRGRKLTEFEKLKAYLMQQIYLHAPAPTAEAAVSRVEQQFSEMYREMEHIRHLNEQDVLRHHDHAWSAHWESPVENLRKDVAALRSAEEIILALTRYATEMAATFQFVHRIEQLLETEELVADLLVLDPGKSWPMLIKLYAYCREQLVQDATVRELLEAAEIVLFKMEFQHGRVLNTLINLTKALKSRADIPRLRDHLVTATHSGLQHNRWNFDSSALDYFNGDYHYHTVTRYVLWKYENSLPGAQDRLLLPGDYLNSWQRAHMDSTIEHISPKTPRAGLYSDTFHQRYLHNLGNLVLMPRGMNSSQGNQPAAAKQESNRDSSYAAHREVSDMMGINEEWTEAHILARKKRILNFISRRWRIPQPPADTAKAAAPQLPQ